MAIHSKRMYVSSDTVMNEDPCLLLLPQPRRSPSNRRCDVSRKNNKATHALLYLSSSYHSVYIGSASICQHLHFFA